MLITGRCVILYCVIPTSILVILGLKKLSLLNNMIHPKFPNCKLSIINPTFDDSYCLVIIITENVIDVIPEGDNVGRIVRWVWLSDNVCVIGKTVGNTFGWRDFIIDDGSYKHGSGVETLCRGEVDNMRSVKSEVSNDETKILTCKKSPNVMLLIFSSTNLISNLSLSTNV